MLQRIIDLIVPADDYPSASEAGVDEFLLELWKSGAEPSDYIVREGLSALDRKSQTDIGCRFVSLAAERQRDLIAQHADEPWFATLCELVAEGYYSNPGNGGNRDAVSWRMIGYQAGLPEGPDGPPPDPRDVVRGRLRA